MLLPDEQESQVRNLLAGFAVASLLVLPDVCFASSANGIVVAQSFGVEIGPGPRRVYRDDDGYRERPRYEEREPFRERRWERDREDYRPGGRPFYQPLREACRIVIIRRETPYGVRTQRIRRCF